MSLQTNEEGGSLDKGLENSDAILMKPLLSYSREALLSLSDLDSCKRLPSGFDESLISEFEDALIRIPDRPRIQGSLSSQSFRRNEYGASPPTRIDAGNYTRGIYGKWESRSSLRNDLDSDSQSDKDSDSGKRFGPQSRRPEHDGLLGSGSFSRSSGSAPGISAPKLHANEPNQLNRTNEPYHPPRPYKAVPHSRRDTDSINDETFGSMEITSEDRAEAERRRRASFEMIRKEQHKALQEKHLEKHKDAGPVSDLCGGLMDRKEEMGIPGRYNESKVSSNDLEKPFASHSPASRPLVPPGFKSNTLEKSSGVKSLVHPPSSERQDIKSEDKWSLSSFHSSKSAQWFSEKEAKATADVSSSMPNDLLSLIVGSDKVNVAPEHVSIDKKDGIIPAVLTCEDLEQSILSEYNANTTRVQPAAEEVLSSNYANTKKSSTHVDNHASLRLLSMLHKSTDPSSTTANSIDISLTDKPMASPGNDVAKVFVKPNGKENSKAVTLETLFGTAFMKELHSVGAPVSVQRGPGGTCGADLVDDGMISSLKTDKSGNEAEKNWVGFNNYPIERTLSEMTQFQLPEEEKLVSISDAQDHISSNTPINTRAKLPTAFGSESSESLHFPLGPRIYRDMQGQQSSPQFQHQQMSPQVPLLYNNHRMSSNVVGPFHNPNVRVAGFDIPSQNPIMQRLGNHQHQFPRGFPIPHNGNQTSGFIQEMNRVQGQGLPFGPRQTNTAIRGMPMPGGNSTPHALQRLIEMELRANSNQNPSHLYN